MTTFVYHNLADNIRDFFSNKSVTREQCDEWIVSRTHEVVVPVENQGVSSYTVTAGPTLFQFREQGSTLDIRTLTLAKEIHPEFVAEAKYHGTFGDVDPLHIYEMDHLSGSVYPLAGIPEDDISRRGNTVKDLARFFAQSWNNPQRLSTADAAAVLSEVQSDFELMSKNLPSRFASNLNRVCQELPSLFSGAFAFPFVLTHGDLNEVNTLVDTKSGNITGIVDWAEARLFPFGFALYGVEDFFGHTAPDGWHYHDNNHRELESLFWQTFQESVKDLSDTDLRLIHAARMAGLFYRYGLVRVSKGVVKAVKDYFYVSLKYLDAFCSADDWAPPS